ncbi:MAG: class I SAM-dependent methyltransferase [Candidatus Algichlamydia australiensis]|nr:class I SAM-dependent methyltransferase [Chlamydiales bacterium]
MDPGAYYAEHSIHQKRFAKEFLQNLKVEPGSVYLDVGCGEGKITSDLTRKYRLTSLGTDRSNSMIEYANNHYRTENLSFIQTDAECFVKNNHYNLITCLTMLHWVKKPEVALQNMYNSLQENGSLYLLVNPRESELFQVYIKTLEKEKWAYLNDRVIGLGRKYSDEYLKIIREIGFVVERSCLEEGSLYMDSFDDYKNHVRGFVQNIVSLKESEIEEFIEDMVSEAKSLFHRNQEGKIVVKGRVLSVICTKVLSEN